jgi:hypothetical protein
MGLLQPPSRRSQAYLLSYRFLISADARLFLVLLERYEASFQLLNREVKGYTAVRPKQQQVRSGYLSLRYS